MEILNKKIHSELANGVLLRLNLGSGGAGRKDCYGVDHLPLAGVDILADLNTPLDALPDNCAGYVFSNHCMEHVREFLPLMREVHRITSAAGSVEIVVPHFSNPFGFSDPTHVRFFGLYTMHYFADRERQPGRRKVPTFYTDVRFEIRWIRIEFYRDGLIDKIFSRLFSTLVNGSFARQNFYERRLAPFFHARQIRYLMQPVK